MIFFRADGNSEIGLGHIMRCLSIADAFNKAGEKSVFVIADTIMQNFIEYRGYKTEVLETVYTEMDSRELKVLKKIVAQYSPQQIIVDSYFVTLEYLNCLRQYTYLTYIDDLAAFAYPVDRLVNYNAFAVRLNYPAIYEKSEAIVPDLCLGIQYTPLRDEFKDIPYCEQPIKCNNILISTGGTDILHLALNCIKYLKENRNLLSQYQYHFIIGAMNQDAEIIREEAKLLEDISLHFNVKDMKKLMMECDIAVSAAGSTVYELCACGLPSITYAMADNQIPGAEEMEKYGLMTSLGDLRGKENAADRIFQRIQELDSDRNKRVAMAKIMKQTIDGYGADRLVKRLLDL